MIWLQETVEAARRLGLHVTTTTEEDAVPRENPYERRGRRSADGYLMGEVVRLECPVGAIALEDLNAMVASATARARREQREEDEIDRGDVVRDAQRRAWDEGYAVGSVDGRADLLREVRGECGEAVGVALAKLDRAIVEGHDVPGALAKARDALRDVEARF